MRLRGRKGIQESLERQPDLVVLDPKVRKGEWAANFGNGNPIHAELGMGKGRFISELSVRNPDVNYIGVDMFDELIRRGAEKARLAHGDLPEGAGIPNLRLARFNIEYIEEMFATGEIERIYLNFSDPWPKNRHARRRLTHMNFLRKYKEILNSRGEIHFKTDSRSLFEFSLNSFADEGLRMRDISLHLHQDGLREDMVQTEYELKFYEQGMPIYRCEVVVGEEALRDHLAVLGKR
ncbi:tRNA (guanosine(46)-N7)-methyltransferase TrmB [Gorillibacterium sp. sgz5001074]|uniref:tRNA (guanosine(46)-N7)-methyltransferase TrmB n=1 Tax=Gorillibacterium sp. sgz5001074 TaxID=3446695 RepID=UPI003F67FCF1